MLRTGTCSLREAFCGWYIVRIIRSRLRARQLAVASRVSISPMKNLNCDKVRLGQSELRVAPICLGTMTFGEQVDEPAAHAILHRSLERGVDFIDTAEMYAVPARKETCGATETIIGNWFAKNPGVREKIVLA